ncbi:MAG: hypothetical protein QXM08_04745 [Thermofilaceae archaeon]
MEEKPLDRLAREYYAAAKEYLDEVYRMLSEGEEPDVPLARLYERVRTAFYIRDLGLEGVKRELERIAREYGGCASCRHSRPVPDYLNLMARWCSLGLRQDTCNRWEPLLD